MVFDNTSASRLDALLSIAIIFLVIILLGGFSYLLGSSVKEAIITPISRIMEPLEAFLKKDQEEDSNELIQLFDGDDSEPVEQPLENETEQFEELVLKAIRVMRNAMFSEELVKDSNVGNASESEIQAFILFKHSGAGGAHIPDPHMFARSQTLRVTRLSHRSASDDGREAFHELETWSYDPFSEPADDMIFVEQAIYILNYLDMPSSLNIDRVCLETFVKAVSSNYNDYVPYHNWYHGFDVLSPLTECHGSTRYAF